MHAFNSLDEPSSIHHHGMFFNSTSWMDGAMGITQWWALTWTFTLQLLMILPSGIPPGQSFDYVVPINSSGQHGTFWAHSHAPGQYPDGLRMPLNIHMSNNSEEYADKYDDEYTGQYL
jgi:iron transport multicopper oxidase